MSMTRPSLNKKKSQLSHHKGGIIRKLKNEFTREGNENIRELILSAIEQASCIKSTRGYESDLMTVLNEIKIKSPQYLEVILHCLSKQTRNSTDIKLIFGYLYFMKDLINLMKKQDENHFDEYFHIIAKYMGYEHLDKNQIVCKFGEKGKKAFIVLQGQIDILIKQNKKVRITEEHYYLYLSTLLYYQEYGLLNYILKENFDLFPVEIINEVQNIKNNEITDNNLSKLPKKYKETKEKIFIWPAPLGKNSENLVTFNNKELLSFYYKNKKSPNGKENINSVSTEEYIERIKVYEELPNNDELQDEYIGQRVINVWVCSYFKVVSRSQGALIGEIALSDPSAIRTATMITSEDCHLGTLNEKSYNLTLKSCAENQRRQNAIFIQSFKIFSGIPIYTFGKKYFNNFQFEKKDKGGLLMNQREKNNNIFLLREGEYEVSIYCSLFDLNEMSILFYKKQCALYNKKFESNHPKLKKQQHYFELLMRDNPQFQREFYKKSRIIIANIASPDLIGLEDYRYENGNCLFTVECKSVRGEMFLLSLDFYRELKRNDSSVRLREKEILIERLEHMKARIELLLKSIVDSFYDYKSKRRKFHLDFQIQQEFERKINKTTRNFDTKTKFFELQNKLKLEVNKNFNENFLQNRKENGQILTFSPPRKTSQKLPLMNIIDKTKSRSNDSKLKKKIKKNQLSLIINSKSPLIPHHSNIITLSPNKDSNTNLSHLFNSVKEDRRKYFSIFQSINLKLSRNFQSSFSQFQFSLEPKTEEISSSEHKDGPMLISSFKSPYNINLTSNHNTLSSWSKRTERRKRKKNYTFENQFLKENLVNIEEYKTFKKNKYLRERMSYLLNQIKKQGNQFLKIRLENKKQDK